MAWYGARQFVDTKSPVYAHDTSAGEKHQRAAELIKSLWQSRHGCLSVQVLQEDMHARLVNPFWRHRAERTQ